MVVGPISKKANIRDVAKACGVSTYTVSSVLNQKGSIGEATTQKVREMMREMNYDPRRNLPKAGVERRGVLHFIVPLSYCKENPFYFRGIHSAQVLASELGFEFRMMTEADLTGLLSRSRTSLFQPEVDRVIFFCPNRSWKASLQELVSHNIPAALIRRVHDGKGVVCVEDDEELGMTMLMEHLHQQQDCQRIAFVGGSEGVVASPRQLAYERYISKHELGSSEDGILGLTAFERSPRSTVAALLETYGATGIVCIYDDIAARVASILLEMKVRIPEDVAIAGYNDDSTSRLFYPPLTTVQIPIEAMVELAVKNLIEGANAGNLPATRIRFESKLIVRTSSRRHPASDVPELLN